MSYTVLALLIKNTKMLDGTLEFDMHKQFDIIELSPLHKVIGFYELLGFRPLYEGGPYYKWISEKKVNTDMVEESKLEE